jgi:hypothetical protein
VIILVVCGVIYGIYRFVSGGGGGGGGGNNADNLGTRGLVRDAGRSNGNGGNSSTVRLFRK